MKVKDMISMLKLADENSRVMLEIRNKRWDNIGYFEIGSDWHETGGYDPDELDWFESINEPKSKANVELTIKITDWDKIWGNEEE